MTAVVVGLMAALAVAALSAGPEGGTVVQVEVELEASNGIHAQLKSSEEGS